MNHFRSFVRSVPHLSSRYLSSLTLSSSISLTGLGADLLPNRDKARTWIPEVLLDMTVETGQPRDYVLIL